jgi:hypothetical protein
MSIECHIDHGRRLVIASASGKLTPEDFFNYQRNVWSLPEVRGFNELVDMSKVEEILSPAFEHISELAKLSANMDDNTISTKFAIVASDTFAYGMGQLYETFRNVRPTVTGIH